MRDVCKKSVRFISVVLLALSAGSASAALLGGWEFDSNLDDLGGSHPGTGFDIDYAVDAGGNGKSASTVLYLDADASGSPDSYIDFTTTAGVNPSTMTVMAWGKLDTTLPWDEHSTLIAKGDTQFRISRRSFENRMMWNVSGSGMGPLDQQFGPQGPQDGQWHHYAGTFDNGSKVQNFYVDGALASTRTLGGGSTPGSNGYSILIGRNQEAIDLGFGGAPRAWGGWVDDAAAYDTALSQSEIQDIMTNGIIVPPPPPPKSYFVERVAAGFDQPVYVTQAPGDSNSLYIVEELTDDFNGFSNRGQIVKLDTTTGSRSSFLTIDDVYTPIEGGLHTMAFHPDFATNGKFYVSWVQNPTSGNQPRLRLDEYVAGGGSPVLNRSLIDLPNLHSSAAHSIDWIGFKPGATGDQTNHLYVTTGDGGIQANDPSFTDVSQDLNTIRGKVLRIDVDESAGDAYPGDPGRNYAIPSDNPFATDGDPNTLGEVYHSGLRNPWRMSFDRQTGDMIIGDVGFNAKEEINFAKEGQEGVDFGWSNREGTSATPQAGVGGPQGSSVNPIHEIDHSEGVFSITGGYVYRGPITELQGLYFFGGAFSERIYTGMFDRDSDPANFNGNNLTELTERSAEFESLIPGGGSIDLPVSFGEDLLGNLYIVDFGGGGGLGMPGFNTGEIFRFVLSGDKDGDGDVDGADFLALQRDNPAIIPTDWEPNYGNGVGSLGAVTTVPEPTALALWATALIGNVVKELFLGKMRCHRCSRRRQTSERRR